MHMRSINLYIAFIHSDAAQLDLPLLTPCTTAVQSVMNSTCLLVNLSRHVLTAIATAIASHNGMLRCSVLMPVSSITSSDQGSDMYDPSQYAPHPHSLASEYARITSVLSLHGRSCIMLVLVSHPIADCHHRTSALL